MVFEIELEDDDHPTNHRRDSGSPHGGDDLPDTLSPVQRAWLLKSLDINRDRETRPDNQNDGTQERHSQSPSKTSIVGEGQDFRVSSREEETRHDDKKRYNDAKETISGMKEDGLNMNSFSACLCCYPIVSSLASQLDLNSLDALSRTCKQFRATLLLFRDQLVTRTLRCSNEVNEGAFQPITTDPRLMLRRGDNDRWTSGRVGKCARDLVSECRKCGVVVCRNCTAKPPPDQHIPKRLRRLCRTCIRAPLVAHMEKPEDAAQVVCASALMQGPLPVGVIGSGSRTPTPSTTNSSASSTKTTSEPDLPFAASAFLRHPCVCPETIYLCSSCGTSSQLLSTDTIYLRGLSWRRQYGVSFPGVSEGQKGMRCGKGSGCLAASSVECEVEVDASECCGGYESGEDTEQTNSLSRTSSRGGVIHQGGHVAQSDIIRSNTPGGRSWSDGGFLAQEVEGIGLSEGVFKMKKRRFIKVGANVDEDHEHVSSSEITSSPTANARWAQYSQAPWGMTNGLGSGGGTTAAARYLEKEKKGERRSWCAWCERVVPASGERWEV